MYYYIVDTPQGVPASRISSKLQELITPMGISGEIAVANPARSAEELTYMGIDKGFTTIVAVGGEELVNTVATIIINESREKIAMGVIPINAGNLIPSMIGVPNNDVRRGAEMIKQRHLDLVDVVQIASKRYMVTEAFIAAPRRVPLMIEVDQTYKAELEADMVHISNDLVATFQAKVEQSFLGRLGLGSKPANDTSQFHGKQIRIVAHEPLAVTVAGVVVAKTPTTFTRLPAALKLITTRAILPQKGMGDLVAQEPHLQGAVLPTHEQTHKSPPLKFS